MKKFNIKKGDQVVVIAGKDRGKQGSVVRLAREEDRVVIDGVNMIKRHLRNRPGIRQAGIVDQPAPLHISNVMLICINCGKPTRVGRTDLPDGTHVRMCKKCNQIIDRK